MNEHTQGHDLLKLRSTTTMAASMRMTGHLSCPLTMRVLHQMTTQTLAKNLPLRADADAANATPPVQERSRSRSRS